ncbi:Glutamate-rich protein 6, partial [Orchesella cincta]
KDTQSQHSQYGGDRYGRNSVSRYGSTRHGVGGRGDGGRGGGGARGGRGGYGSERRGEGLAWSPSSEYYNLFDKEDDTHLDDPAILTANQCWERASKLFKKPNKALVIPPPENLAMYLEKKYPKSRWPRGTPVASRNYPNGSVFVSQYASGSSRVFYPHGGLAVIISAPSPATSRVLVVRDPSDHIFFFDKALLADLNSSGKGTIYGDDGVVKLQYSPIGGFKLDGLERGQRWQWHRGGVRMIMKLNKYISLRISDQNKIFLNFYGNMRGFLVNVASGKEVILMNPDKRKKDPLISELRQLIRPKTVEDNFDYMRGKFNMPATLGFVDKAKHYRDALNGDERNVKGSQSARNLAETSIDLNQYFAPIPRRNRNIFTARSSTDPITYPDDFADIARLCRVSEEPCYDPNENTFEFQYCL